MNIITELRTKRLKWIEANRENDFEDGIKNLLTELYPDNAHFIYELLQNAEDAEATKVTFTLGRDSLKFSHNGKRQFTPKDIESITSIGQSTKKDDFLYDNRNGWLEAIEFGKEKESETAQESPQKEVTALPTEPAEDEQRKKQDAAKLLNLPLEIVEKLFPLSHSEVTQLLEQREQIKLQKSNPINSGNATGKFFPKEQKQKPNFDFSDSAPTFRDINRTPERRERSVIPEYLGTKEEAREFLQNEYQNGRQSLLCQVCHEGMPFKTLNGEDCFFAVKIVEKTDKDNVANYLCCCPNCAAMYQYANPQRDNMKHLILRLVNHNHNDDEASKLLKITLADSACEVRFSNQHFTELVNFLNRSNSASC